MFSILSKTVLGLKKTRSKINNAFASLSGKSFLDESDIDALEEALIQADLGWETVDVIIEKLKEKDDSQLSVQQRLIRILKDSIDLDILNSQLKKIILIVGINGTGKTTSSAKISAHFSNNSEKVILVAADTYRAAAIEQIKIWANRINVKLIANESSSDPASVAYDGVNSALANNYDRVVVDTAGRMNTSANLMNELGKIHKVISRQSEDISVLMTLDANTGQNALSQIKDFNSFIPIDGVILTKMDGTTKGGIAVPILSDLKIPVYYIGVGEGLDDLIPFDIDFYLEGLVDNGR
tara:strand:- start:381 stop:1268 length:888 start_codon:yes stop_codon:yes gene_type:complete